MSAEAVDVNFEAPVKSVSIANMVRMREAVIDRLSKARALIEEAGEMAKRAHLGFPGIDVSSPGNGSKHPLLSPYGMGTMRAAVDCAAWKYLMDESGLRTFMDAEARRKWDSGLYDREVPELTPETIEATFRKMHDSRAEMFERGVIRCFKQLSWNYKTNSPWRFGKRIILRHLFSVYGGSMFANYRATDELDDLMRVFHVLDGKPEPDHRHAMYSLINANERAMQCENEYVHIKWFKKGSGHVTFKRPDLVDKLNQIVAKHYPGALAHDN